jgi:hypothetical protein
VSASGKAASVCLAALLASAAGAAGPAPGRHRRIKCSDAQWTYDLYVPRAYAADGERRFPVLFISSPGGNPGRLGLESWAERRGVILVSINDSKNALDLGLYDDIQGAVVRSVESSLRAHPCLRFSIGLSGAAWASMHLAKREPEKHAGIVMLAHSGNGADRGLAKHVAVAFIHAENDEVHGADAVRRVYRSLEGRGDPVREVCGGWGHSNGPLEERVRMLDWMLEVARLTHPHLPPGEKRAARAAVTRRVEALGGMEDDEAKLREAETLLKLPGAERWPEARELRSAWFAARFDLAEAEPDLVERHEALTALSEDERLKRCAPKERSRLAKELSALRRASPVKEEWKAEQAYRKVAAFEEKYGRTRTKLARAAQSYAAIAKRYPGTKAGLKAREAAERLLEELGSGKKR